MKLKNLPDSDLTTLREKYIKSCELWAKNPTIHPTVDTYHEAYWKGAKNALMLPVMPFQDSLLAVTKLGLHLETFKDREHVERAWKAIMHGDAKTAEEALEMTEKADPPEEVEIIATDAQEAADTDKDDAQ
jgi:hypothetical protein